MNELAYVLYAHTPTNDDELELKVGDTIEVLGLAEEGWWKGRLKGRVGVFPSNFVKVIDNCSTSCCSSTITTAPDTTATVTATTIAQSNTISSPSATSVSSTAASKLNLFGIKSSRNSLSSNSLNSNSSNQNNNNNLIMDNTQHPQDSTALIAGGEDQSMNSSERRPKPIRGISYGDIFSSAGKSKPLPPDPTGKLVSERFGSITVGTIQKQIPKKPPPPAPTMDVSSTSNGNSNDQAPALPPKPANQFSPHLLQHSRPLPPPIVAAAPAHYHHQQQQQQHSQQVREQAKVIYAYEPVNNDELAIEAGDIIDIIDKNIEDAGWWKGELRGKIGVFPDNFVELIEVPTEIQTAQQQQVAANHDHWLGSSRVSAQLNSQSQPTTYINQAINDGKIKSVFASTPKGFSKELENNLEKQQQHNSPASFLSLKRNKLQQQLSNEFTMNSDNINESRKEFENVIAPIETSTNKLNHITANRAKGPSRRPPSNVLNKRNQLDESLNKKESNGKDETLGSLAINSSHQSSNITQDSTLSSLPANVLGGQQHTAAIPSCPSSKQANEASTISAPIKPSLSLENVIDNNQAPSTPKTSQRAAQQPTTPDKGKVTTTPPWMVELRKAHAEKKRDTPIAISSSGAQESDDVPASNAAKILELPVPTTTASTTETIPITERKSNLQSLRANYSNQSGPQSSGGVKSLSSRYSGDFNANLQNESQRNSLLGTSSIGNQDSSNNELSPLQNRLSNVLNNKHNNPSAANTKGELNLPHALNATSNNQITNGSSNNANINGSNSNVPSSSANKFSGSSLGANSSPKTGSNHSVHQKLESSPESNASQKSKTNVKSEVEKVSERFTVVDQALGLSNAQYDNLLKQISKDITSEISELREEFKRMQVELRGLSEMKSTLEVIKTELKSCQSATENQKRYIKELVNNLADERKKIAAMQTEIDRTLK